MRAFQLLEECADGSPACDAFDLATTARALLTLYQHPGPLGEPTGAGEIAEEIRRQLREACRAPIADGKPYEWRTFDSHSGEGIHGYVHTELCVARPPLLVPVPPHGLCLQ
ncbi:hypothetical protein [Streptomyces osmaniensis]|uniref:hypothetical protein n=1 Tax=Streptomyces osmaniensis TaxID=593134 RepID=UPI0031FE334D